MARKAKAVSIVSEVVELVEEEVVEQSTGPSLLSSLVTQLVEAESEVVEAEVKKDKNEGVGQFIRKLIAEGMSNKDILPIVHEQYGNKNTTYACVAWYRNKMKKDGTVQAKNSALSFVERFAQMSGASEGEVELVKSELRKVA